MSYLYEEYSTPSRTTIAVRVTKSPMGKSSCRSISTERHYLFTGSRLLLKVHGNSETHLIIIGKCDLCSESHFSRHGIPSEFVSDNGPQFDSHEMKEFAESYRFTHITSSPHYPQSNGLAERTVKTVKQLIGNSHGFTKLPSYPTSLVRVESSRAADGEMHSDRCSSSQEVLHTELATYEKFQGERQGVQVKPETVL